MAAIIFDFDGTIADSFDYVAGFLIDEANVTLSEADIEQLRGMSMAAMARNLGHAWWRLPGLFIKGRRRMQDNVRHVKPFKGVPEVLKKLHAEGHELFIVSSNSVRNVHTFLHHHKLHTLFLEIYGGVSLFGKAPALRRLLREQKLEAKDCIYIGDELRDMEASESVGMRNIAVGWGFARIADLDALKPTALARTPGELMTILEEQ